MEILTVYQTMRRLQRRLNSEDLVKWKKEATTHAHTRYNTSLVRFRVIIAMPTRVVIPGV